MDYAEADKRRLGRNSLGFGDLKEEDFGEWMAQNRGTAEGLDLSDIPPGDLHAIADRIREWKKKKLD